jgi:hypothetical protein
MGAAKESPMKTVWPVWVAFGLPLLLVALNSTPIGSGLVFVVAGIPILLFTWACFGMWALILAVRHLYRRQWFHAMSNAVLPLFILGVGLRLLPFLHLCNDAGDIVYFMVERSSYLNQIRSTPTDREPRLLVFDRGGMSWSSRGYVYDESDEVTHDERLQSANWKARAANTELTCGYYAQPFPGHISFTQHWYLASFDC